MRISVSKSVLIPSEKTFGFMTGYFFTINVVVGSGFLTLPSVFHDAGWLFSSLYMMYAAVQSYLLAVQLIEVMSKVEVVLQLSENDIKIKRPKLKEYFFGRENRGDLLGEYDIRPEITDRRLDISECARVLFGTAIGFVYSFMLFLYTQGAMTGYAGIFASSLATEIPLGFLDNCDIYESDGFGSICFLNYWIFLIFYGICMIIFVIVGLKEQKWMQSILTISRFMVMGLIIMLSISLMIGENDVDSDEGHSPSMPGLMNIRELGSGLSAILFAFVYQVQFSSIAEFVTDRKKHLINIAKAVAMTCFVFYFLLGILTPVGLAEPKSLITLSFKNYSAGYSQDDRPLWTYFIAYFLVTFPAADVFSCFPLMAIAVSDNLMSMTFGASNTASASKKALVFFRVLVCVIPLTIAFFVYDLGVIVEWLGICSFFLVPIMIPLMHIAARIMVPIKGYYDVPYSPRWLSLLISGFSVVLLIIYIAFEAANTTG